MIECYCDLCGNPKRDKKTEICKEIDCYWYSHWEVDKSNPESVKRESEIKADIRDAHW